MKILFIHREELSGTGASTYSGQLTGALSSRHDTQFFGDVSDLEKDWDVIHALNLKHFDPDLLPKMRAPFVVDVHDAHWAPGEPFYPTPDWPARWAMAKMRQSRYMPVLEKADRVIVHSRYVADRIALPKTRIAPYAVEAIEPGPPLKDRPPVVIFAGRDYFRKGLPVLLAAWRHVGNQRPGARLEIAGREFLHGQVYASLVARQRSVTHLGGIPRVELIERIRNAKVLVLPSYTESFGIVLLEAMAAGTPAVGADTGGIPEALRGGKGGILVQPGNARSLASALIKCLDDDPRLDDMIQRGFRIASEHSVDAMAEAIEAVYREVAIS